jgi:putative sigma-54 modulation protein
MRLHLTGRHLDVTPPLRRLVVKRMAKLERVLNDGAMSAQVVLAREKHRHLTEITLHARGDQFLHAVGDSDSWEKSLTDVVEKIGQQALRLKGKRQQRKRHGVKGGMLEAAGPPPAAGTVSPEARPGTDEVRPRMPRVVRASRQAVKVMSLADAARNVDRSRDRLLVFLDAETDAVNVLYRRGNGELALIEIEL